MLNDWLYKKKGIIINIYVLFSICVIVLVGSDRIYLIMVYRFGSLCLNLFFGEVRNNLIVFVSLFFKENFCI